MAGSRHRMSLYDRLSLVFISAAYIAAFCPLFCEQNVIEPLHCRRIRLPCRRIRLPCRRIRLHCRRIRLAAADFADVLRTWLSAAPGVCTVRFSFKTSERRDTKQHQDQRDNRAEPGSLEGSGERTRPRVCCSASRRPGFSGETRKLHAGGRVRSPAHLRASHLKISFGICCILQPPLRPETDAQ
jgi:hypothetical protein